MRRRSAGARRAQSRHDPPANPQAVLARDGYRCSIRGCGNTQFLEVHHIRPRSEGGSNKLDNLAAICFIMPSATAREKAWRVSAALARRACTRFAQWQAAKLALIRRECISLGWMLARCLARY